MATGNDGWLTREIFDQLMAEEDPEGEIYHGMYAAFLEGICRVALRVDSIERWRGNTASVRRRRL